MDIDKKQTHPQIAQIFADEFLRKFKPA